MYEQIFLCLCYRSPRFSPQKEVACGFLFETQSPKWVRAGGYVLRIDSLCRNEGKGDLFEFVGLVSAATKFTTLPDWRTMYWRRIRDVVVIYIGVNGGSIRCRPELEPTDKLENFTLL